MKQGLFRSVKFLEDLYENLYKFSSTCDWWELLERAYSFDINYVERMRIFLANNTTILKMHKAAEYKYWILQWEYQNVFEWQQNYS